MHVLIVMCEYSKFRNEYKYSKFSNTYRHQFLTYLNRMTPIFHLRNHAQQPAKSTNIMAYQELKLPQQKPQ